MNQAITKICLLLAGTILGLLWFHSAFIDVQFNKTEIGPFNFVYFIRVGTYQSSYEDWLKTTNEMNSIFNKSIAAGIYYDNPQTIADPNSARVAMGFFVDQTEANKIQDFLIIYPNYKQVVLPHTESTEITFPYKSFFSFTVIEYKVYPKLTDYLINHKLKFNGILEMYMFGQEEKTIEFNIPQSGEYLLI